MKVRARKLRMSAQSSREAKVMRLAASVFGSRAAADQWASKPALGLESRRPIDLIGSAAGRRKVETLLNQIEHGVYA